MTVASTNMGIWHQRLPYKLVGMDNFFQVPYVRDPSVEKMLLIISTRCRLMVTIT